MFRIASAVLWNLFLGVALGSAMAQATAYRVANLPYTAAPGEILRVCYVRAWLFEKGWVIRVTKDGHFEQRIESNRWKLLGKGMTKTKIRIRDRGKVSVPDLSDLRGLLDASPFFSLADKYTTPVEDSVTAVVSARTNGQLHTVAVEDFNTSDCSFADPWNWAVELSPPPRNKKDPLWEIECP